MCNHTPEILQLVHTDPTVVVRCMDEDCPPVLIVKESSMYSFQCYSDQINPIIEYSWKVNNIVTRIGTKMEQYTIKTSEGIVNVTGSLMNMLVNRLHENITCQLGNNSKSLHLSGK